jgi:hypothetical protein
MLGVLGDIVLISVMLFVKLLRWSYSDWPHIHQVAQVTRVVTSKRRTFSHDPAMAFALLFRYWSPQQ